LVAKGFDSRMTQRRRQRWWLIVPIGVLIALAVTVTPSLDVTFVDARSGMPIGGLRVMALWHLHSGSAAGPQEAAVLRIERLTTAEDGSVHLGFAALLHAPVFPLGFGFRDTGALPVLYVVDERYEPRRVGNDRFNISEPPPISFLSLQRSSIDGDTVHVTFMSDVMDPARRRDIEAARSAHRREVDQAVARCRQALFCLDSGL
jgi:hypothetical protein